MAISMTISVIDLCQDEKNPIDSINYPWGAILSLIRLKRIIAKAEQKKAGINSYNPVTGSRKIFQTMVTTVPVIIPATIPQTLVLSQ